LAEQIQQLREHHAADRIEYKRDEADAHNQKRLKRYESFRLHAEGNRDAQQQRDEIRKSRLCGFRKAFEYAAFPQQFPNIRKPTSATDIGATRPATTVTMTGNNILVFL
jgi:hypothetical protein